MALLTLARKRTPISSLRKVDQDRKVLSDILSMGMAVANPKASSPAHTPYFHHKQCQKVVVV